MIPAMISAASKKRKNLPLLLVSGVTGDELIGLGPDAKIEFLIMAPSIVDADAG